MPKLLYMVEQGIVWEMALKRGRGKGSNIKQSSKEGNFGSSPQGALRPRGPTQSCSLLRGGSCSGTPPTKGWEGQLKKE